MEEKLGTVETDRETFLELTIMSLKDQGLLDKDFEKMLIEQKHAHPTLHITPHLFVGKTSIILKAAREGKIIKGFVMADSKELDEILKKNGIPSSQVTKEKLELLERAWDESK